MKYIGTRIIEAEPMDRLQYNIFRGWVLPIDENGEDKGFKVVDSVSKHTSWLPIDEFSKVYTPSNNLSFGLAIEAMKKGEKVARKGWNGKGMFIYYVPENVYPANGNKLGTMNGVFENDLVPYGAYIAMKTAQNNVVPWLASQTDVLAEDWEIVE